jgi:hypothetical protein
MQDRRKWYESKWAKTLTMAFLAADAAGVYFAQHQLASVVPQQMSDDAVAFVSVASEAPALAMADFTSAAVINPSELPAPALAAPSVALADRSPVPDRDGQQLPRPEVGSPREVSSSSDHQQSIPREALMAKAGAHRAIPLARLVSVERTAMHPLFASVFGDAAPPPAPDAGQPNGLSDAPYAADSDPTFGFTATVTNLHALPAPDSLSDPEGLNSGRATAAVQSSEDSLPKAGTPSDAPSLPSRTTSADASGELNPA